MKMEKTAKKVFNDDVYCVRRCRGRRRFVMFLKNSFGPEHMTQTVAVHTAKVFGSFPYETIHRHIKHTTHDTRV